LWWDGVVPYVVGSPVAIPNVFKTRFLALRVLKDQLPSIVGKEIYGNRVHRANVVTERLVSRGTGGAK
jgi:hypothetical protein